MADSTNWNGENAAPQPGTVYSRGYDVKTTGQQANEGGANCYLVDGADNTHILLTLIALDTTLGLSGSDGQSQLQKDFYPKNFKQPSFTLTIQARSQGEAGRIAEFVHKAQRNAISRGSLMKMLVPRGGLNGTAASSVNNGSGMRGTREGISMDGYVANVPRTHKRHDPAPVIQFDFVVAKMNAGIFQDQPYKVYKLAKWSEIVESQLEGQFISPPMTIEQEQSAEERREEAKKTVEIPRSDVFNTDPFDQARAFGNLGGAG